MEGKVAVLGSADFVMAFSTLGLDCFSTESVAEEVEARAKEILDQRYALVVVAENIAAMTEEVFEKARRSAVPCVVVVPFMKESEGYATKALGRVLKMATGIDILSN
ncbi:MAG: hypothetical protein KAS23_05615 [Anaerohalosphaera sp.]|nr:hypothetical protein [Anaerohalosphaera sp.]